MVSLRRPHYAWIICLGGALSLFAVMGMGINVFSVYQPYIIQLNGFSNAQGSWITTTRSLFTLAAMLTVNQLCARIGLRLVMTLGVVLLALSCFCFGLADSFPLYCAAGALTGLAYGYGGMVPLSLAVGHWFRDRRGWRCWCWGCWSFSWSGTSPATWAWSPTTWAVRRLRRRRPAPRRRA